MDTVILDTNIIAADPSILSQRVTGWRVVVPGIVGVELDANTSGGLNGLSKLLQESAAKGLVEIVDGGSGTTVHDSRLMFSDNSIISIAESIEEANTNGRTVLATDDYKVRQVARRKCTFEVVNRMELNQLLASNVESDKQLSKQAQAIVRNRVLHIVVSLAAGVLLTLVVQYGLSNIDQVVSALTVAGTLTGLAFIGVLLFALRAWQRLTYGILEFLFGLWAVYLGLQHDLGGESQMLGLVKLVGGMYALVRGLDNIGKGLKPTRLYGRWSIFFPE